MAKNSAKDVERYKAERAYELELLRATTAFEHAVLKPTFLLNGGALVIVFALLGTIWKDKGQFAGVDVLILAIGCWAAGLASAAVASVLGYLSQWAFLKARHRKLDSERALDAKHNEEARR